MSRLRVFLNTKEISDEVITCGSFERELDIESGDFEKGTNDLLFEILEKEGKYFDVWLKDRLFEVNVKIYFLPYTWKKGELLDK